MDQKISPTRKNIINVKHWFKHGGISQEYKFLLVLAALHIENKISDELLKGQLSSLRNGDLIKFKNTYKSKISNKWYSHEKSIDIFEDYLYLIKGEIDFYDFLKYLNLFLNKNYNYCLNVFFIEYIAKQYDYWDPEYCYEKNFYDYIKFYGFGDIMYAQENKSYCCCSNYSREFSKNEFQNFNELSNILHGMKKGNLNKIPFFNIEKEKNKYDKWF